MIDEQIETKYKEGDWVHYGDSIYRVEGIFKGFRSWMYMIKDNSFSRTVLMSVGDERFRKV